MSAGRGSYRLAMPDAQLELVLVEHALGELDAEQLRLVFEFAQERIADAQRPGMIPDLVKAFRQAHRAVTTPPGPDPAIDD